MTPIRRPAASPVLLVVEIVGLLALVALEAATTFDYGLRFGGATALFGLAVAAAAVARRRDVLLAGGVAVVASLGVSFAPVLLLLVAGRGLGIEPIWPSWAEQAGLLLLVAAAVRRLPRGQATVLAVAGVLAVLASPLMRSGGLSLPDPLLAILSPLGIRSALAFAAFAAFVIGCVVAVATGLSLRRRDRDRQAAVAVAQVDERMDLARELHDVVAHDVTGIVVHAQAAQLTAADDPARLLATMAMIEQAGLDALDSMRRVVSVLRSSDEAARSPEPGLADLAGLTERFATTGPPVALRLPPDLRPLPAGVGATVYRVVQESLTNARKHARTLRHIDVEVAMTAQRLRVVVRNDGVTGPAGGSRGFGLVGMTERVRALGGLLTCGPDGPDGWVVCAELPLDSVRGMTA